MLPAVHGFDPNHPTYKCCCSSCYAVTGAWIIGILEAISLFANIINAFLNEAKYHNGHWSMGVSIGSAVLSAIIISFLFYGLHQEKANFVLPHLVLQVLTIIGLFLLALITTILLATGSEVIADIVGGSGSQVDPNEVRKYFAIIGGILIGVCLVVAILEIWFFRVVLCAYRYLKDKQMYATTATSIISKEQGYASEQPPAANPAAYPIY